MNDIDQTLHIQTEGIQVNGKDTYHNHRYEPTPYEVLDQVFSSYPLQKEDVLVDFGCGKGRLNFYLHDRFGCSTVGIEFSKDYYDDACNNLLTYRRSHQGSDKISFHHICAQDYSVQPKETHFYFFNPFSLPIFMKTVTNIILSHEKYPREITLLMYYPDVEYLYYLEFNTPFEPILEIPVGNLAKDSRECFVLYRM